MSLEVEDRVGDIGHSYFMSKYPYLDQNTVKKTILDEKMQIFHFFSQKLILTSKYLYLDQNTVKTLF